MLDGVQAPGANAHRGHNVRRRSERVGDRATVGQRQCGDRLAIELTDENRPLKRGLRVEGRETGEDLAIRVDGRAG